MYPSGALTEATGKIEAVVGLTLGNIAEFQVATQNIVRLIVASTPGYALHDVQATGLQ